MNRNDSGSIDFNEILAQVAESFEGVTGKIDLNDAGDRISENYDFWTVTKKNNIQEYKWEKDIQNSIDH